MYVCVSQKKKQIFQSAFFVWKLNLGNVKKIDVKAYSESNLEDFVVMQTGYNLIIRIKFRLNI